MSIHIASLDLGQAQDYSALIILEAKGSGQIIGLPTREPVTGFTIPKRHAIEVLPVVMMDIRHIERFPLGTKYADIGRLVENRLRGVPKPCYLVVDETGVGISVVETMQRMNPAGITILGSQVKEATCPAPGKYHVPKRDLVSSLQVRFQNRSLRIAKTPHTDILTREILAFRAKITLAGHDTYEAWREAEHDDLVLAAAMGCWYAEEVFRHLTYAVQEQIADAMLASEGEYQISPV